MPPLAVFCFLGCTESKEKTTTETATAESIENTTPVPTSIEATTVDGNKVEATMEIAEPATTTPVTTAPGMNPPHGQPGHDCAVAVGAPLNSKSANAAAPQLNTAPANSPVGAPTLTVPPVSNTAPGLNPPHGQPGHDCAIAVGAPLKK